MLILMIIKNLNKNLIQKYISDIKSMKCQKKICKKFVQKIRI